MRAGKLDRLLQLQEATLGRDGAGEETETWSTIRTLWGEMKAASGDEAAAAQEEKGQQRQVFTVRWFSGASTRHRLLYDGRQWDIVAIAEIGRREALAITAEARSE